jgi:hypothetical protein
MRRIGMTTFLFFNLLDVCTTQIGFSRGIPEGNPLMALAFSLGGPLGGCGLKLLIVAMIIVAIPRLRPPNAREWPIWTAASVAPMFAVWNNLWLIGLK